MTALIFGALIGFGLIKMLNALDAGISTKLIHRVSPHLIGFRTGRLGRESGTAAAIAEYFKSIQLGVMSHASAKARREQILWQLPDFLDLMTVAITAGETLYSAMHVASSRASGLLANEFRLSLAAIDMGSSVEAELSSMAARVKVRQLEEFANKVALAQRRGTPMARLLAEQSTSIRADIRNELLVRAGKNETKMLIPLVFLILPITVLFAIYPSLNLLNFNYQ
jgi:tight adherence protein C